MENLTPEELEKLHVLRKGLYIFASALMEVEQKYQDNISVRYAVAERGKLMQVAIEDVCTILEARDKKGAPRMSSDQWFLEETVALKKTAIYYGIPKYGHQNCYKQAGGFFLVDQVDRTEPDIEKKHCSACGKPLLTPT